jgi:hypothetical protein
MSVAMGKLVLAAGLGLLAFTGYQAMACALSIVTFIARARAPGGDPELDFRRSPLI